MATVASTFLVGAAVLSGGLASATALAQGKVTVLVRTAIDAPDPQSGMKSEHSFTIDFAKPALEGEAFETGITSISVCGLHVCDLASVRDKFTISEREVTKDKAKMKVTGQTASGVRVLPNIDYAFFLSFDRNGKGTLSGCHDGYPSYIVKINNQDVYNYKHKPKNILKLFGGCDVTVGSKNF